MKLLIGLFVGFLVGGAVVALLVTRTLSVPGPDDLSPSDGSDYQPNVIRTGGTSRASKSNYNLLITVGILVVGLIAAVAVNRWEQ